MIDRIIKIDGNEYQIIYDNRSPVTIYADNGFCLHILEYIISPRNDMSYSEFMSLQDGISEITVTMDLEKQAA